MAVETLQATKCGLVREYRVLNLCGGQDSKLEASK